MRTSPLMTKREAAAYLRLDESARRYPEQAIDRLIARGEFTPLTMGKRAMLHVDELDKYIEKVRARNELHS